MTRFMRVLSPIHRIYLQVCLALPPYLIVIAPLQFEIKALVCEIYYTSHPSSPAQCSLPEVDAQVAAAIAAFSMLALITCALGVVFSTLCAKRWGLKRTLAFCVGFTTILNLFYIAAVHLRGELGLALMFLAQFTIIIGGVGGAQMCATSIISIFAEEGGTSRALGTLGGMTMCIAAASAAVAGYIYDWHPQAPFVLSAIWNVLGCIMTLIVVPPVPASASAEETRPLDLIRIFLPRTVPRGGKEVKDYSLMWAGLGGGLSIIATSYSSAELSIWGMNSFGITPPEMGALGAWMSLSKAIFLVLFFPRICKAVFQYLDNKQPETQPLLETTADAPPSKQSGDLYLLVAAIILELAACVATTFSTAKWHLFALSTFIPGGAGVGALVPALIVHFVPPEKKTEAVGAATLLTQLSAISAILIFGYLFAWLSKLNLANLVFLANAFVGALALIALLFVRHP